MSSPRSFGSLFMGGFSPPPKTTNPRFSSPPLSSLLSGDYIPAPSPPLSSVLTASFLPPPQDLNSLFASTPLSSLLTADFIPPPSGLNSLFEASAPFRTILGGEINPLMPRVLQWQHVRERFTRLLDNLAVTKPQRDGGDTTQARVRACLNRHYYGVSSETANSMLIGSWGKDTRVRPPRDVDMLFLLPGDLYWRYELRLGNKQSALLQEVKDVLIATYPDTAIRGDRQVVLVPFDKTSVEVALGFRCTDGSIIVCDTNDGGSYRTSTAEAELADLAASDAAWNGNTRALVRIMKQWQRERNVPIKSFWLERLAREFLAVWPHSHQDRFYYDWMVRDFLAYLITRANGYLVMPAGEVVWLGDEWLSRAETAHRHAVSACDNERANRDILASVDWQYLFGAAVPMQVS